MAIKIYRVGGSVVVINPDSLTKQSFQAVVVNEGSTGDITLTGISTFNQPLNGAKALPLAQILDETDTPYTSFDALVSAVGFNTGVGGGSVNSVTASAPLTSSGGANPNIRFNPLTADGNYILAFASGNASLVNATTADINDSLDRRYSTDAQLNILANTTTNTTANIATDHTTINVGTGIGAKTINVGGIGDVINIYGTLQNQNVTNLTVTDKLVTYNKGGAAASAFNSGFEVEENNVITGYFTTNATRNGYALKAPATFEANFDLSALAANRSYQLPPASGTFALTSDLASNILQNGNTFGANVLIGTNDNFDVILKRNGIDKLFVTDTGVGIGGTPSIATKVHIQGNATGATTAIGSLSAMTVQNDVTASYRAYQATLATAPGGTLTDSIGLGVYQGTYSGTVTNNYGVFVAGSLTGGVNNFGFFGDIAAGANRYNLYMNGTADNYIAGSLGLGAAPVAGINLFLSKNITGAVNSYTTYNNSTIQSDVTTTGTAFYTALSTAAASFNLTSLRHYVATQATIGLGSTVTEQIGFLVNSSLIGATNNYAFSGNIPSGTGRYNLYMNGSADNYLNGSLGIGTTTLTGFSLRVGKNITGASNAFGISQIGQVQNDVTGAVFGYRNDFNAANTSVITSYDHFYAAQATITGATITNQSGFRVESSLTGATNNYGFRGQIAANTNRYNLYMDGTADNHLRGKLGSGNNTTPTYEVDVKATNASVRVVTSTQTNGLRMYQQESDGGNFLMAENNNYLALGTNGTSKVKILADGTVRSDVASYETLVLNNNDFTNRKYVDDKIFKTQTGRIATATTTSATLTPLTSASITITVAGDYAFDFGGTILHSNNDVTINFCYAKNGTAITNGTQSESAHTSRPRTISMSELFTGLLIGDVITVRWSTTSGTATVNNYNLVLS